MNLMSNVISTKAIKEVSAEVFCNEFEDYYGINIPLHPMNTIITKMKDKSLIDNKYGKYTINFSAISDIDIKIFNQDKFGNVLSEMKSFVKNNFDIDKNENEIENIFIGYINAYDKDILYAIETNSMLPTGDNTTRSIYLASSFIEFIANSKPKLLEIIEDIILANIHLHSVFFIDKNRKIKLNRVFVYLDTRFILRLTGIEGIFRQEEYKNLLEILRRNNCNLRIFDVHYKEVVSILNDCKKWLEDKENYDPKIASRALRYFVENNYKVSDVIKCEAEIDNVIKNYKIGIDVHNYEEEELNQYNIDENRLREIIIDIYNENSFYSDNYIKESAIWNDIKAISAIYRKRKGFIANDLQNVRAVFVTNNYSLARAVRKYNLENGKTEKYNECLTDTYWGTAIWLNTAYSENTYFARKLLADCISLTELNPKLKDKYLKTIKEKNDNGEIVENEYYMLREYPGAIRYLQNKTLNDDNEYVDSLPEEILSHFRAEATKPLEEIIKNEQVKIKNQEDEILDHKKRVENQRKQIELSARRFAKFSLFILAVAMNVPSIVLMTQDLIPNNSILWGIRILGAFFGVFFSINGFKELSLFKRLFKYKRKTLLRKWSM